MNLIQIDWQQLHDKAQHLNRRGNRKHLMESAVVQWEDHERQPGDLSLEW